MSKTNKKLAAASVLAAGLGAAYFTKKKNDEASKKNSRQPQTATATQNAVVTTKTARESIIPTETTKHLHARKNQTALMRKMPMS